MKQERSKLQRPFIFGEVLFDEFEDGSAVLGGAPFNVAWHLQGFGANPLFASRIGSDARGDQVVSSMDQWSMDQSALQRDDAHPTGRVSVTVKKGQPSFSILPDQAYDHIDLEPLREQLRMEEFGLLYYGSLIARSAVSRKTLLGVCQRVSCPSFVDINIRPPWWETERMNQLLPAARWLKLNDVELEQLTQEDTADRHHLNEVAQQLRQLYGISLLVVTEGAKGATMASAEGTRYFPSYPIEDVVDTVGAGDAFSAVTILGLLRGWPEGLIMERAIAFAGEICRQRGATALDPEPYRKLLHHWGEDQT